MHKISHYLTRDFPYENTGCKEFFGWNIPGTRANSDRGRSFFSCSFFVNVRKLN